MTEKQSSRRDFLRKTGIATAAMVSGLSLPQVLPTVKASSTGHLWSETTTDSSTNTSVKKKLAQNTTLEWIKGKWENGAGPNGGWEHRYRATTLFSGRKPGTTDKKQPALARQQIGIKKQDYDALYTTQNQPYTTGVYPEFQSGDPNYSSLGPLFQKAISEMSFAAEFAFTAAEAIDNMVDANKPGGSFDFHQDYDYFGSEYADGHHYEKFIITNYKGNNSNDPEEDTHHYFQLVEMGSGAYGWVDTRQEWNMRAIKQQHPHQLSVNSNSVEQAATTQDGSMVYQTSRGYTVEEIPPHLIPLRQRKLPITPEEAERHMDKSETMYLTLDGPIAPDSVKKVTGTGRNDPDKKSQ